MYENIVWFTLAFYVGTKIGEFHEVMREKDE